MLRTVRDYVTRRLTEATR